MLVPIATLLALAVPPDLDTDRCDEVRAHVLPSADERRWLDIPWRSDLWTAVEDARESDKPILLWAMNGHPLGCV